MIPAPFPHPMQQPTMMMQQQQPMMNMGLGFGCPQQEAPVMPRACSHGPDMGMSSSPAPSCSKRSSQFTDSSTRAGSVTGSEDEDSVIGGAQHHHPKKKLRLRRHHSDDDFLSTNYRYLGGKHIFGDKTVWPKTQKIKCLMKFDVSEFNPLRLASMDDHVIDELMFVTTGCTPMLKLSDLKVTTKGKLRHLLHKEYLRLRQREPNRLKMLAGDYSNLSDVCAKLGYPEKFLIKQQQPPVHDYEATKPTGSEHREGPPALLDKPWDEEEEEEDESTMRLRIMKELQQHEAQLRMDAQESVKAEVAKQAAKAKQMQAKKAMEQQMKALMLSEMKEKMRQEELLRAEQSAIQSQEDNLRMEASIIGGSSQEAALLAGLGGSSSPRPTELPEGSSFSSIGGIGSSQQPEPGSGLALSEAEQALASGLACAETQEVL